MIGLLKQINLPSPKTAAIGLNITNGIVGANILIYITALFLTSYPATWIPYFFVGRSIIDVIVSFWVSPLLTRNVVRTALLFQFSSVFVIFGFDLFLHIHWYYLPIIYSFLLVLAGLMSEMITGNCVRGAFDVIEFKQISPLLSVASVVGKIVFSLGNIWLIKEYTITILPFVITILLSISCLFIYVLKPLPTIIRATKREHVSIRCPLVVNLFLFSLALAFCYTLIDYLLRSKLAVSYNQQKIGQFMSIFAASAYTLSTIITFLFAQPVAKRGVTNLLNILPIYWIILPWIVIFFPSMIPIALMGAGEYIFHNFNRLGRTFLLNILPPEIRIRATMAVLIMSESIGVGLASLLLILISGHITTIKISLMVFFFSLSLFYFTHRLKSNYIATLKDEMYLKRFTSGKNEITPYSPAIEAHTNDSYYSRQTLSIMLQSKNVNERRIAARLLPNTALTEIESLLSKLISDSDDIVSTHAIEAASKYKRFELAPNIIKRLTKSGVYYAAKEFIAQLNEQAIPLLMVTILQNKSNQLARIDILVTALAELASNEVEKNLIELAEQPDIALKQAIANESMNRSRRLQVTDFFKQNALRFAYEEAELIHALRAALSLYPAEHTANEIINRINLALERYLHWIIVYHPSDDIFGMIPTILHGIKSEKARAMELLNTLLGHHELADINLSIFSGIAFEKFYTLSKPLEEFFDPWLSKVIEATFTYEAPVFMNNMQKVFILRQIDLFKDLPAEILVIIAEDTEIISMAAGQKIFLENDLPTGLYMIVSGQVTLTRQSKLLSELKENNFFGELSLIDNEPRIATAIAKTDGTLLFLNKDAFTRITNDLPQVLRSVTQVILHYLRIMLAK